MRPVKIREKKGPSQGIIQKCEPQERNAWAPKFEERTQDETLKQERCASKDAWDLEEDVHKLKKESKETFFSPPEAQVIPAPSSTNLLSRDLDPPITVVTANGEVQTDEEAQVCVHDLHIFVSVQFLEDTPTILSLGKLCKEHGYTFEWRSGSAPRLTNNGNQTFCRTENCVPVVVPGQSSSSTATSSSTSPSQDPSIALEPSKYASEKDLSSEELEILRRSRTATVVTAKER